MTIRRSWLRMATALLLVSTALTACPCGERGEPPEAICSPEEFADLMRGLSRSFFSGFGEKEVKQVVESVSSLRGGGARSFDFGPVDFQGHEASHFTFVVLMGHDGYASLIIHTFKDLELQRLIIAEIQKLDRARHAAGAK